MSGAGEHDILRPRQQTKDEFAVASTKDSPIKLSERQFMDATVQIAQTLGWKCSHFPTSMSVGGHYMTAVDYDGKGFPDCIFIHSVHRVLLVVEFKSQKGRMSPEQLAWADLFETVESAVNSHAVKYFVWKPAASQSIIEYLTDPTDKGKT